MIHPGQPDTANRLFLVSAGPGDAGLITPNATQALAASSDLVAYGLYTEILGQLCDGKTLHEMPLGEETARAHKALELAASGKTVALVSSGDIGIYAMATLVFELIDQNPDNASWKSVEIEVIPGVSAMQANSAMAGALLGHDFCTISLSDLLTPWDVIENRIHCAGRGDFVVSFYNPVSRKRDWQLDGARDILLQYRPAATPVVLGRNLTRPDQTQSFTTLEALQGTDVDMFTCVSVGNRESRTVATDHRNWVYTPRGYRNKT